MDECKGCIANSTIVNADLNLDLEDSLVIVSLIRNILYDIVSRLLAGSLLSLRD